MAEDKEPKVRESVFYKEKDRKTEEEKEVGLAGRYVYDMINICKSRDFYKGRWKTNFRAFCISQFHVSSEDLEELVKYLSKAESMCFHFSEGFFKDYLYGNKWDGKLMEYSHDQTGLTEHLSFHQGSEDYMSIREYHPLSEEEKKRFFRYIRKYVKPRAKKEEPWGKDMHPSIYGAVGLNKKGF